MGRIDREPSGDGDARPGEAGIDGTEWKGLERILALAAHLKRSQPDELTLELITTHVPGYRQGTAPLVEDTGPWETARKKLRRDLDVLRSSFGIDVTYEPSTRCYVVAPALLTSRQRLALLAAAAVVRVEGLEATAVPGELGTGLDDTARRIVLRVHPHVAPLRAAIADRRRVRFEHAERTRTVEPWRIALWRNHWYLQGLDVDATAARWFRLDRIDGAVTAISEPGTFAAPDARALSDEPDLDPNTWGQDPEVTARLRVHPDHEPVVRREFGAWRVDGDGDDGDGHTAVLELTVRHYSAFVDRLLRFRDHVRVVEPPVLVARVRTRLSEIASGSS